MVNGYFWIDGHPKNKLRLEYCINLRSACNVFRKFKSQLFSLFFTLQRGIYISALEWD